MTAQVVQLPTAAPARVEGIGLNLSTAEVIDASGGYVRPGDQLRALHALGFSRAYRRSGAGPVILERTHYDAVTRGQFGPVSVSVPAPATPAEEREPVKPNRAAFLAKFGKKGKM